MAMAHRTVAVRLEPLGAETGIWCNRCMRSSGVRAWVAVIFGDRMHLQSRSRCRDCNSPDHLIED